MTALWGGRFDDGPSEAMAALSKSTDFDMRLAPYDLEASIAHAHVLHCAKLLDADELERLTLVLRQLREEVLAGRFGPQPGDEDVHATLERGLVERLGELGGKLRAGRSRNDQIATDLRLYCRDRVTGLTTKLLILVEVLAQQAERHVASPMPGMTHLQHAQPITFGHKLAAHAQAFLRDVSRLQDWDVRADVSPLGSGALAGSSLPLDPEAVAADLGFTQCAQNSVDAVADRDFVAELLFVTSMVGIHLSQLAEEVILWASQEFSWIELDDAYSTGSSIMPQKKNPDIAELARGKTGRLIGHVSGFLATLKGLPHAYNRDLQEDKEPLFDACDTLALVLPAMTGMVATMTVNTERMADAAPKGYSLATEVADWLVRDGVPFKDAHEITGRLVMHCAQSGIELDEVSDADLLNVSGKLRPEVRDVLSVPGALEARKTSGSTGPTAVAAQVKMLHERVSRERGWLAGRPPPLTHEAPSRA